MNMQMRNGLSRKLTIVDPDIVPIRAKLSVQLLFCLLNRCKERCLLIYRNIKKGWHMTFWQNQAMSRRELITIPNGIGKLTLCYNPF